MLFNILTFLCELKRLTPTILDKAFALFHVFAQFLFTTSEMQLDYYHQNVNVRIAS